MNKLLGIDSSALLLRHDTDAYEAVMSQKSSQVSPQSLSDPGSQTLQMASSFLLFHQSVAPAPADQRKPERGKLNSVFSFKNI